MLLEIDLGVPPTSCGLVATELAVELDDPALCSEASDPRLRVKLDDPSICGEAGDPCLGVDPDDRPLPSGLVGPDIEAWLDERAIDATDCELVGRCIAGMRNNFSVIPSLDGFSCRADLADAGVLFALHDCSLAVCDTVGIDVAGLSKDFSLTAAVDGSWGLCDPAGAGVTVDLDGL